MATTLRGDDNFDSASPIPAGNFTAKAWVNFNGTGTVAIRADGNVSSITDNGTGNYTVNFDAAVESANYAETVGNTGSVNPPYMPFIASANYASYKTSSSFRFLTYSATNSVQDTYSLSLVVTL